MKKIRNNSVLEIWSGAYINDATTRLPEDINAEIVQIDLGNEDGDYIVEVVKHHKNASSCNKEDTKEDTKENINDYVIGIDLSLSDIFKQQVRDAVLELCLYENDDMKKVKEKTKNEYERMGRKRD